MLATEGITTVKSSEYPNIHGHGIGQTIQQADNYWLFNSWTSLLFRSLLYLDILCYSGPTLNLFVTSKRIVFLPAIWRSEWDLSPDTRDIFERFLVWWSPDREGFDQLLASRASSHQLSRSHCLPSLHDTIDRTTKSRPQIYRFGVTQVTWWTMACKKTNNFLIVSVWDKMSGFWVDSLSCSKKVMVKRYPSMNLLCFKGYLIDTCLLVNLQ